MLHSLVIVAVALTFPALCALELELATELAIELATELELTTELTAELDDELATDEELGLLDAVLELEPTIP